MGLKCVRDILPDVRLFRCARDLARASGFKSDVEIDLLHDLDFVDFAAFSRACRWKHPPVLGLRPNCCTRRQEEKGETNRFENSRGILSKPGIPHGLILLKDAITKTAGILHPGTQVINLTDVATLYTRPDSGALGMFGLNYFFYPWGYILQILALVHAVRRRPEGYWYLIILMGGMLGALAYIVIEVLPDAGLARDAFTGLGRKSRIRSVETTILDNPSAANFEELGDLLFDEKRYSESYAAYNKSIGVRDDSVHAFYRRAQCAMELGKFSEAVPDLEHVVASERKYDSYRAAGFLAHAYANTGQAELAEAWFLEVTELSTNSETLFNYASFLKTLGRKAEAREWAEKILSKQRTLPRYLKRLERPWAQKTSALVKELSSS